MSTHALNARMHWPNMIDVVVDYVVEGPAGEYRDIKCMLAEARLNTGCVCFRLGGREVRFGGALWPSHPI